MMENIKRSFSSVIQKQWSAFIGYVYIIFKQLRIINLAR